MKEYSATKLVEIWGKKTILCVGVSFYSLQKLGPRSAKEEHPRNLKRIEMCVQIFSDIYSSIFFVFI